MRHTLMYLKNARSPQNVDKVPIKEVIPLSLKNRVSGGMRNTMESKCLYEISLLFKCWTENEFSDKVCKKQIENLNTCVLNYTISKLLIFYACIQLFNYIIAN
ncbi:unnamed protein product [Xylocopa violacea]|uniref:CHCH domain-containing protein n=1 Tax=Xylocopa violacea TaxID=135666 RepID=A0ABP1N6A0_XYLVO